jgi:hypothetical protein
MSDAVGQCVIMEGGRGAGEGARERGGELGSKGADVDKPEGDAKKENTSSRRWRRRGVNPAITGPTDSNELPDVVTVLLLRLASIPATAVAPVAVQALLERPHTRTHVIRCRQRHRHGRSRLYVVWLLMPMLLLLLVARASEADTTNRGARG